MTEITNAIRPRSRKAWRNWLKKNHAKEQNVWCIVAKKDSRLPGVSYVEAVEEALCFGWIDSKAISCDEDGYYQYFAQRKAKSPWTKLNKTRVEMLTAKGLMAEAGFVSIEAAKASGGWYFFDDAEEGILPDDLKLFLEENSGAKDTYEKLSSAKQKQPLMALALKKGALARRRVMERL